VALFVSVLVFVVTMGTWLVWVFPPHVTVRAVFHGWRKQRDHARALRGVEASCSSPQSLFLHAAEWYTESGPRCVRHLAYDRSNPVYAERIEPSQREHTRA
jgi:hypothetical protein